MCATLYDLSLGLKVCLSQTARNLGVISDASLFCESHISSVWKFIFHELLGISHMRPFLSVITPKASRQLLRCPNWITKALYPSTSITGYGTSFRGLRIMLLVLSSEGDKGTMLHPSHTWHLTIWVGLFGINVITSFLCQTRDIPVPLSPRIVSIIIFKSLLKTSFMIKLTRLLTFPFIILIHSLCSGPPLSSPPHGEMQSPLQILFLFLYAHVVFTLWGLIFLKNQ